MKFLLIRYLDYERAVTPFTGVWIEINPVSQFELKNGVTPFTGVWIEINIPNYLHPG